MNREEARVKLFEIVNKVVDSKLGWDNNLINDIYNDFESRTCENCKHYFDAITRDENNNSTTTPACIKFCLDDGEYTVYPSKDFGCNKFERKQDDNL